MNHRDTMARPTRVLLALLVGGSFAGCGSEDDGAGGTDLPETTANPQTTTANTQATTANTQATTANTQATTTAADPRSSSTQAEEPAGPTPDEMRSTAEDFFAAMAQDDFAGASELFVDNWTFESFGAGTLTGGDGDDLVDVLGFNGTILSFEPGACVADETGQLPTVRCHDNRVHGPLPTALGIDQSFPLPLDLLLTRDGRLVGVLPNRVALEQHPDAAATVAASSRIGLDLTGWIAESAEDSSTLIRPPGRAIIPTEANAERLIELAQEFVAATG